MVDIVTTPSKHMHLTSAEKRQNGAYYTPDPVTTFLCAWAIQSSLDTVLEPSFGGCGFLRAAIQRLAELNSYNPAQQIYGCDIDDEAFNFLAKIDLATNHLSNFVQADFLSLKPRDFAPSGFTTVIGNPPYISHHHMSDAQKQSAFALATENVVSLDKRASLWAYFVLHSLSFLNVGGRMAWILPASIIFSDYGTKLRGKIEQHFKQSLLIVVNERLFREEGTDERTVVLLSEDYSKDPRGGRVNFAFAGNMGELQDVVSAWKRDADQFQGSASRPIIEILRDPAKEIYQKLASQQSTIKLGRIANIKIGIVTGANKFFIIDEGTAKLFNLPPESLTSVLAKFSQGKGLCIRAGDMEDVRANGERCLLVDTSGFEILEGTLQQYIESFPLEDREKVKTFAKRVPWHRPNDGKIPHAFFPCMQDDGPRLLLNNAGVLSTNTIHRVFFTDERVSHKLVALSLLTTFSQLSAELHGRAYGSGVLKHEPSEASRIDILLPEEEEATINSTFHEMDALLRSGQINRARTLADSFIMRNYFVAEDEYQCNLAELEEQLRLLRALRRI